MMSVVVFCICGTCNGTFIFSFHLLQSNIKIRAGVFVSESPSYGLLLPSLSLLLKNTLAVCFPFFSFPRCWVAVTVHWKLLLKWAAVFSFCSWREEPGASWALLQFKVDTHSICLLVIKDSRRRLSCTNELGFQPLKISVWAVTDCKKWDIFLFNTQISLFPLL